MSRVDLHVKVLNDRVRQRAINVGLDAIVYAPHFTPWPEIVASARRYSDDQLTVVPAREIFTGSWRDRAHVLALDLTHPVPDFISLEQTMTALRRQDACIVVPHPSFLSMSLSSDAIRRYRADIDAIEVYNPKFLPWHEPRARRLAAAIDRPVYASSYAHLASTVGQVSVDLDTAITDQRDVIEAIRDGAIDGMNIPSRLTRLPYVLGEQAHLVWENTWMKAKRVLSPGLEATHPDSPLYDGWFERIDE